MTDRGEQSGEPGALPLSGSASRSPRPRAAIGLLVVGALLARHRGLRPEQIVWSGQIRNRSLGQVRVEARWPREPSGFAFDVDLTGPSIHPTDLRTRALLAVRTNPP